MPKAIHNAIGEATWQKAEKDQIRRERNRLHKEGRIRNTSTPNVMVKTGERWEFPDPKEA